MKPGKVLIAVYFTLSLIAAAAARSAAQDSLQPIAQNCCDCPPTATDQQCFLQCNAILARCTAPARRAAANPHPRPR
ncbi:MAG: hypothetical protein ACREP6_02990, partial [Candidatus Binataceae bacterium]